jgi:hypothetical protein
MANDPQDNVDVPADDELADKMLGDVSGGYSQQAPQQQQP